MGKIRTLLHYLTLGLVPSNEEIRQMNEEYETRLKKERERKELERKRRNTPCTFDKYLSYEDFKELAFRIAKPIKRLTISVDEHIVTGKVRTMSGADTWFFELDFNDFGKVTGNYWFLDIGNTDSSIPRGYAKQLSEAIVELREERDCEDFDEDAKEEFFCPNCNADLRKQVGFEPDLYSFICQSCGQKLFNDNIYSGDKFEGVYWYCDRCGALLNKQIGFKDDCGFWHCTECGYKNYIDEENIINK